MLSGGWKISKLKDLKIDMPLGLMELGFVIKRWRDE
jgi:hypothetical protein